MYWTSFAVILISEKKNKRTPYPGIWQAVEDEWVGDGFPLKILKVTFLNNYLPAT